MAFGPVAAEPSLIAPDTAWGLTVEPGVNELHLDWEPPNSTVDRTLAGYKVYRGTEPGNLSAVDRVRQTRYNDTALPNGTTFYYRVNATYVDASEGSGTAIEDATTYAPPTRPRNATARAGPTPGNITITWDPPAADGGTNVTNYTIVAYNATGNRTANWTRAPGNRTVVDRNLSHGVTRSYRVAAVNAVGPGNDTGPLNATTWRRPAAPANVTVEAGPGPRQMNVTFDAPDATGGANLTDYVIYRSTDDANLTRHTAVDANRSWFVDEDVPPGTEIRYAVAAANPVGVGPRSPVASATSHSLPTAPSADAKTGPGTGNVTVTWSRVDGGAFNVTAYVVEHRPDASADWARIAVLGPDNASHVHQGLDEGTTHSYRVRAVTPVGQGPASNVVTASALDLAEAPENVTARAGPDPGQITVTWQAPAATGDGTLTGYRVEVRSGGAWTRAAEVGPDATTHTLSDLGAGVERVVRVRALTGAGTGEASTTASATTYDVPSPPRDVEANRSRAADRVAVTWTAPATSGLDLTEYRVVRRSGDGAWTEIAAVDANRTRYVDEDLPDGGQVDYAVRAVNAVGAGPRSTADSVSLPSPTDVGKADTTDVPTDDAENASSTSPSSTGSRAASAQGGLLPVAGGLLGLVLLGGAVVAGAVVLFDRDDEPTTAGAGTAHGSTATAATAATTTAAATPTPPSALPAPGDVDPSDEASPGQLRTRLEQVDVPERSGPLADVADTLDSRRQALLDGLTRGEPVQEVDVARLERDADRFVDAAGTFDDARLGVDDVAARVAEAAGRLGPSAAEAVRDADRRRRPDEVAAVDAAVDAVARYRAWTERVADAEAAIVQAATRLEDDVAADADELLPLWQATLARRLADGPTRALADVVEIRVAARRQAIDRLDELDSDLGCVAELRDALAAPDRAVAAEVAGIDRLLDHAEGDALAEALDDVQRPGLLGAALTDADARGSRHLAETLPRLLGAPERHVGDAAVLDRVTLVALRGDADAHDALRSYVAGKLDATDPVLDEIVAVLAAATPIARATGTFDDAVVDAIRRDLDRFDVVAHDALRDRVVGPGGDDALRQALDRLDDVAHDAEAGLVGRRRAGGLDADQLHTLRRRLDVDPDTLDAFLAEITFDGETDHDA